MEFSGDYVFSQDRQTVWHALNNPEVLRATIPGCESLDQVAPGEFEAKIALKIGFFRFKTSGDLRVEVGEEAKSYRLHGGSAPTMFGSGKGIADVSLRDREDGGTELTYAVHAQLEGRFAKMGANLVSGQIQSLGTRFFERFETAMTERLADRQAG